jgi:hypothetical protein
MYGALKFRLYYAYLINAILLKIQSTVFYPLGSLPAVYRRRI